MRKKRHSLKAPIDLSSAASLSVVSAEHAVKVSPHSCPTFSKLVGYIRMAELFRDGEANFPFNSSSWAFSGAKTQRVKKRNPARK